ncbi:glycine/D-amino acid oxidase, deaminating [Synechococcus sp. PCC 7502]|uniref:NAD(P)/FAD-dependent oxidoreductase n=1 Tax=Synechococcus sp. PCC 7502 TaxID=1173263 RepID=UPI00029F99B2|nr:FAD-dependent oxidoreductase [Synechococcus sp. PCC 7502]AFY75017.1 glycine/D-amino acid oxidase, deaminating [Synechococcus sp. PCC 7502]
MIKIIIVGAGIIGAAIAYELSQVSKLGIANLNITVLEAQSEVGQGSTKSALGVMMAACSITTNHNGALTNLRLTSLRRYESLVPELEAKTGIDIPYNRHGIFMLINNLEGDLEDKWKALIALRASQGFRMEWIDGSRLRSQYPQFQAKVGLHSFDDRSVNPHILLQALVTAAKLNGVEFKCDHPVHNLNELDQLAPDWVILAAGLGSSPLIQQVLKSKTKPDVLFPVGGQAIQVYLPPAELKTNWQTDLKSVLHCEDVNIVPAGNDQYLIGATVEFDYEVLPRAENVDLLLEQAIGFCPAFAKAKILSTWAGDRPRPKFQGSPIIGFIPNLKNTLVATGHFRNGVLMAPVTAQIVKDLILEGTSDLPWQKQQLKT